MPTSYPVITSKAASKHFEKMKLDHAELVSALSNQSVKANAYRQQQSANLAAENNMKMEMEKEKMASQSEAKKNDMDFALRQGEIDIKRASIATQ